MLTDIHTASIYYLENVNCKSKFLLCILLLQFKIVSHYKSYNFYNIKFTIKHLQNK